MAVSKRLRYEILRRDNHACRYCGRASPDVPLTVDHVIPTALGGSDKPDNLVTACQDCNAGKSASAPDAPIVDDVASDALRWRWAMIEAASIAAEIRDLRDARRKQFHALWNDWTFTPYVGKPFTQPLPVDWDTSLDRFYEAGLIEDDIADAIDNAMKANRVGDRFKYFCGICWHMVRDRQTVASELLAAREGEATDGA